jgi:hypothetical protein
MILVSIVHKIYIGQTVELNFLKYSQVKFHEVPMYSLSTRRIGEAWRRLEKDSVMPYGGGVCAIRTEKGANFVFVTCCKSN